MDDTFEAVAVTHGGHHYFGYYDIQPWNGSGTHLLVLSPPFADREPTGADVCEIGLVEQESGEYRRVAETRAWNFQQGCFLHWHPKAPDEVILYNDRIGDRFVCVELNIRNGERRVLPRPISAIDRAGERATSLNFARLAVTRPGYGYSGLVDPFADECHPADDGVFVMDLETGDHHLAVSMAQIAALYEDQKAITGRKQWFNHNVISDDGKRFIFLSRWVPEGERRWLTALFTADMDDGGHLRKLYDYGLVSHFDWCRSEAVLAFARYGDDEQPHFWLVPDGEGEAQIIEAERWPRDGHCCYSSDYRFILNDSYPGGPTREQLLMLYEIEGHTLHELGAFHAPEAFTGPIRCDLHPRFSRDDRWICFDSTHSGRRQVYVMDVSAITAAGAGPGIRIVPGDR